MLCRIHLVLPLQSAIAAFVLLTSLCGTSAVRAIGPQLPNIVLLVADDLGYGELSCQGGDIPTPAIDSIANHGVRFTAGYVTASYCSPSRAGLLTGRLQTRFGHEKNPVGAANCDPRIGLSLQERTLANRLRDRGYATALVGKWHLGGTAHFHPLRRGFDEFFGFLHEGHTYASPTGGQIVSMFRRKALPDGSTGRWTNSDGSLILSTHMGHDEPPYDANNPLLRGSLPLDEPLYFTDAITREATRFIERNRDRPFFLCVAYSAVHSPLQTLRTDWELFAHIDDPHRRIFAGMVHRLDQSVGAILAELSEQQVHDHTLVVFLSDNGGPTKELTSSNRPLRGGKGSLYEGGIRVPLLLQWPDILPTGKIFERPVLSCDIAATALAATGVDETSDIDGVDLTAWLTSDSDEEPHAELFWRMGKRAAFRSGNWKLVLNHSSSPRRVELYDLAADLGESENLARSMPDVASALESRWLQMNKQMVEPAW